MTMTYRRANHILLTLIILINAYVIAAPFWPRLVYWYQERTPQRSQLTQAITKPKPASPAAPQPDALTIPSMLFTGGINQGRDTYAELNKGVWLWPGGSTPDKGGNTIMLGHRFTYTNPRGVFYFLDKVAVGDQIGVTWQNKHYLYKVVETKVVKPSEVSILNPTSTPTLTLYTCTPLWSPHQRLVVVSHLESQS